MEPTTELAGSVRLKPPNSRSLTTHQHCLRVIDVCVNVPQHVLMRLICVVPDLIFVQLLKKPSPQPRHHQDVINMGEVIRKLNFGACNRKQLNEAATESNLHPIAPFKQVRLEGIVLFTQFENRDVFAFKRPHARLCDSAAW